MATGGSGLVIGGNDEEDENGSGQGTPAAPTDFPCPSVADALRPEVYLVHEKQLSITIPDIVMDELKRECALRGEALRTVVLRWFLRGGMTFDPALMVDLRARTHALKAAAYKALLTKS
jgi:hypothetical protein